MRTSSWPAVVVALSLAAAGCGAPDENTFDPEIEEARTSTAWTQLIGTWNRAEGGALATLALTQTLDSTDRHFVAEQDVTCVQAPCDPVQVQGTWRATARYIYLTLDGATQRYSWTRGFNELTLRQGTRVAYRFTQSITRYCQAASDCQPQSLAPAPADGPCANAWMCTEQNQCEMHCSCNTNGDCSRGEYCQKPEGTCGGEGRCYEKPTLCTQIYAPVCGCNGRTYSNACTARAAGVNPRTEGACN